MCGISGIINLNNGQVDKTRLVKMTNALAHRGPDSEGFWFNAEGSVGLGHRRLSIIDLSSDGDQPFNFDNKYIIVFNGEIYNYIEIREKLQKKGYSFRTKTDTEVLLALYDHKREKMFEDIDGMFAFVIYDLASGTVFGARDRFGEKPFYYTVQDEMVYFASEIKSFWACGLKKNPDKTRLYFYLKEGICEFPKYNHTTFFEGVYQLLPSHYFIIENGKLKTAPYWNLDSVQTDRKITLTEAAEELRRIFNESVKLRLRSDVPVGSSLSGGVDSSIVVKQIEEIKSKGQVQKTFSARFKGFAKDEGKFIELLLKSCGNVEPFYTWPDPDSVVEKLDKIIYHQDEPFGSASIIAQWHVAELAKRSGITVLLDGQGADELFAGYLSFVNPYLNELYKNGSSDYRKQVQQLNSNLGLNHHLSAKTKFLLRYGDILKYIKPKSRNRPPAIPDYTGFGPALKKDVAPDKFSSDAENNDDLNKALLKTIWYDGLPSILRYADRSSMAHSVEVRLPYLSHKLAEFAFSLPSEYKLNEGFTKYILRKAYEKRVPSEIIWRRDKIGYEAPQSDWMNDNRIQQKVHEAELKLKDCGIINDPLKFAKWNILMAASVV